MYESEAITKGIRVHVTAQYSAEHSKPLQKQWFFLYTIEISNESKDTVQLISRHWVITDADNKIEEVRGPGVVGKQPVLAPGRIVRIHVGLSVDHALRDDEGHLSHGHDRWEPLRGRGRAVRADRTVYRALSDPSPASHPSTPRRVAHGHRRAPSQDLGIGARPTTAASRRARSTPRRRPTSFAPRWAGRSRKTASTPTR